MNNITTFNVLNFFESTYIYTDIFESHEFVWESLSDIESFIDNFDNHPQRNEYTEISEKVYLGKNATIDDSAKIINKAIIGPNSTVGHAAFLRGNVLLADNVRVGHGTEVKHSIVLSNSALAHLNYVGDSVVGNNTNISGGATLANWRFDKKVVEVSNGNEKISTGLEKLGGIIGDNSFIGVGSVINPGTLIGKGCVVYPLVSVSGYHPSMSKIK